MNKLEYQKKWRLDYPEKARAQTARYRAKNREKLRLASKIYSVKWRKEHPKEKLEQVRKYQAKHPEQTNGWKKKWSLAHPEKMMELHKKCISVRRKLLGFNPINKYFKGSHAHHIDREAVIYIPEKLHRSVWHSIPRNINMDKINKLAFDFLNNKTLGVE
jgi:hypothetical protein